MWQIILPACYVISLYDICLLYDILYDILRLYYTIVKLNTAFFLVVAHYDTFVAEPDGPPSFSTLHDTLRFYFIHVWLARS